MQAEGSENVTSVFFVTVFVVVFFFFKLNMCIYNVYIYTEIYILGNNSMHIDFRSYLVVLWTGPPDFFVGRDGSPPAQVAQNLQLPFIFAYLGSEKLSDRRLELERVQEKVPWIRLEKLGPVGWVS